MLCPDLSLTQDIPMRCNCDCKTKRVQWDEGTTMYCFLVMSLIGGLQPQQDMRYHYRMLP